MCITGKLINQRLRYKNIDFEAASKTLESQLCIFQKDSMVADYCHSDLVHRQ